MVADLSVASLARGMARPRVAVIHDDAELLDVLADAFSATHHVGTLLPAASMRRIAEYMPHLLVIGPLTGSGGSLSSWEVVALARAHRNLRDVPIILLSPELDRLMMGGDQLATFKHVHVLGMPFDLEVLTAVIRTVERDAVNAVMEAGESARRHRNDHTGRLLG